MWLNPGSTNVMVEVVAHSVAWSRRVFASSIARRTCNSADEFNRETSLVILKGRNFLIKKGQMMKKRSNDKKSKNGNKCHYLLLFSIIWTLLFIKYILLMF